MELNENNVSKTKIIVYKPNFDRPMKLIEIGVDDKMVEGRKLTSVYWCDYDANKDDSVIKEHNERLKVVVDELYKLQILARTILRE